MAFTDLSVISSWGGPSSNSYVDPTFCDSFIRVRLVDPSAWTNATTLQQAAACLEATRDIDTKEYLGGRYYYNQLLKFPRQLLLGFPWNKTAAQSTVFSVEYYRMYDQVQQATAYQALWILRQGGRNYYAEKIASGIQAMSQAVGPVKEYVQFGRVNHVLRLSPEAVSKLQEWGVSRRAFRA